MNLQRDSAASRQLNLEGNFVIVAIHDISLAQRFHEFGVRTILEGLRHSISTSDRVLLLKAQLLLNMLLVLQVSLLVDPILRTVLLLN